LHLNVKTLEARKESINYKNFFRDLLIFISLKKITKENKGGFHQKT